MEFKLKRDLVFFDIESTGLNVLKDRIVQIALIKYFRSGEAAKEKDMLINPGIPISEEAMAVHGITPDKLKNKPAFHQVAKELFEFIGFSDLAGYNSDRFDIPILIEEFARAGFDLSLENRKSIDLQKIFYKMEPRTLKAAYKLFCSKNLEGAHDALADVRATVEVLQGQIKKYDGVDYIDGDGFITKSPIKNDIDALHEFTYDERTVDVTQRLKYNARGEMIFNFGKYKGQIISEVLKSDPQYARWIQDKDFSVQVKKIIKRISDELKARH